MWMIAVMRSITIMGTFKDAWFASITVDIVRRYDPSALSKESRGGRFTRVTEAQTPADNVSVVQIPAVIAHGLPGSVVEHLHSPLSIGTTSDKSRVCSKWKKRESYTLRKKVQLGTRFVPYLEPSGIKVPKRVLYMFKNLKGFRIYITKNCSKESKKVLKMVLKTHLQPFREPLKVPPVG